MVLNPLAMKRWWFFQMQPSGSFFLFLFWRCFWLFSDNQKKSTCIKLLMTTPGRLRFLCWNQFLGVQSARLPQIASSPTYHTTQKNTWVPLRRLPWCPFFTMFQSFSSSRLSCFSFLPFSLSSSDHATSTSSVSLGLLRTTKTESPTLHRSSPRVLSFY